MLIYIRMYPTLHNSIAARSTTWTRVLHRIVYLEASRGSAVLGGVRVCIRSREDQLAEEPAVCLYDVETRGRELTLSLHDAPSLTFTSVGRR